MLSVDEALRHVLEQAKAKAAAEFWLRDARGLALAEDVTSDIDSPPHDKSLVDGYAVQSADLAMGSAELQVLEEITAGQVPTQPVTAGAATRIMTGAPVPEGADAVVMIEQTELLGDTAGETRVRITTRPVSKGQNIMPRAASMARGQQVLASGALLRPAEIGVLAEVGKTRVRAIPRATLAVLATGNELVDADEVPGPGAIRNSNGPLLTAAAEAAGARATDLGIARDEPEQLRERMARGLESDVLVISGGVSAGVLDLVPAVLAGLGVTQVFHKVNLRPGKPLWFGVRAGQSGQTLVFGLPGNPVSSLVCFELFVRPALARLAGRSDLALDEVVAELTVSHSQRGDRPTYYPSRLSVAEGRAVVEPLRWQGSGDLRTLVEANALAVFPAGERQYAAGERVRVLRLP